MAIDPLQLLFGKPEEEPREPGQILMSLIESQPAPVAQGGGGGGGGAPGVAGAKSLRAIADRYGWDTGAQWRALQEILQRESGGNRLAQNPNSTAFGRWQFLDDTWAGVGGHKTKNRRLQDIYGLKYVKQRYGSPLDALAFHNREGYY